MSPTTIILALVAVPCTMFALFGLLIWRINRAERVRRAHWDEFCQRRAGDREPASLRGEVKSAAVHERLSGAEIVR